MPKAAVKREGSRRPLNMRTTEKTRLALESAAKQSRRSLTQEVEYRLEQSFLFEKVIASLADRMRSATMQLLADTVDGRENLSAGIRVAQRLSFFDLPNQMDEAIEDLRKFLPRILSLAPLSFEDRVTDLQGQAMFDAALLGPVPGEKISETAPPDLSGGQWETPENLSKWKPSDPERDLLESVKSQAFTDAAKYKADTIDEDKTENIKKSRKTTRP